MDHLCNTILSLPCDTPANARQKSVSVQLFEIATGLFEATVEYSDHLGPNPQWDIAVREFDNIVRNDAGQSLSTILANAMLPFMAMDKLFTDRIAFIDMHLKRNNNLPPRTRYADSFASDVFQEF